MYLLCSLLLLHWMLVADPVMRSKISCRVSMTFWAVKRASQLAVVLTAIRDPVIARESDLIHDLTHDHLRRAERDEVIAAKKSRQPFNFWIWRADRLFAHAKIKTRSYIYITNTKMLCNDQRISNVIFAYNVPDRVFLVESLLVGFGTALSISPSLDKAAYNPFFCNNSSCVPDSMIWPRCMA